ITKPSAQSNSLTANKKQVVLMNFILSPKERQALFAYQPKKTLTFNADLPSKVDLGMKNVPVLNQGAHGTCVTFAATAAIDAILEENEGDYVSQLCSLELGKYLEKHGTYPSGWSGSFGPWVLDQLLRFGIVSKEDQKAKSCASVTEYPLYDYNDEG